MRSAHTVGVARDTHMAIAAITYRMAEISASFAEYSAWSLTLPTLATLHLSILDNL